MLTGMLRQMFLIQLLKITEEPLLHTALKSGRRIEIQDARFLRPNDSPLVQRWQPTVVPILDTQYG